MIYTSKILVLLLMLLCTLTVSAEVYKWVDEYGRIHFSDQPPLNQKSENIELDEIVTYTSAKIVSSNAVLKVKDADSKADNKYRRKKRVVMYSAAWCGVCTTAKSYFKKNKIPFKEYDIDTSKKGKNDFKKLKARGVPVILIGKKRLNGFDVKKFESLYRS